MERIKSPKKYPIYKTLLALGVKPGNARKLIERAVNAPDANILKHTESPSAFCIWSATPDTQEWVRLSKEYIEVFYA